MNEHRNREWLIEHYVTLGLSCKDCGQRAGVCAMVLRKWLLAHGIPTRKRNEHMKGERNSRRGKPLSESTRLKIAASLMGHKRSAESIAKQRSKICGKNNSLFGKPRTHGKFLWVQRPDGRLVDMRSRWEVLFADWLDSRYPDWEYEPQTFLLGDGSAYTPDFLAGGIYYEIKGYMTDEDQAKIDGFRLAFPKYTLRVIRKSEMDALGLDPKKSMTLNHIKLVVGRIYTCPTCSKEFNAKMKKSIFCSRSCVARRPRKERVCFECSICGRTVATCPSRAASQKTCSKACRYAQMARSRKASGPWFR